MLWCDLTPSLLPKTISCYLSHLPYLGWDITGFKRPCAYICFLAPVISRLACLRDIFSRGYHGNGVYIYIYISADIHSNSGCFGYLGLCQLIECRGDAYCEFLLHKCSNNYPQLQYVLYVAISLYAILLACTSKKG